MVRLNESVERSGMPNHRGNRLLLSLGQSERAVLRRPLRIEQTLVPGKVRAASSGSLPELMFSLEDAGAVLYSGAGSCEQ